MNYKKIQIAEGNFYVVEKKDIELLCLFYEKTKMFNPFYNYAFLLSFNNNDLVLFIKHHNRIIISSPNFYKSSQNIIHNSFNKIIYSRLCDYFYYDFKSEFSPQKPLIKEPNQYYFSVSEYINSDQRHSFIEVEKKQKNFIFYLYKKNIVSEFFSKDIESIISNDENTEINTGGVPNVKMDFLEKNPEKNILISDQHIILDFKENPIGFYTILCNYILYNVIIFFLLEKYLNPLDYNNNSLFGREKFLIGVNIISGITNNYINLPMNTKYQREKVYNDIIKVLEKYYYDFIYEFIEKLANDVEKIVFKDYWDYTHYIFNMLIKIIMENGSKEG